MPSAPLAARRADLPASFRKEHRSDVVIFELGESILINTLLDLLRECVCVCVWWGHEGGGKNSWNVVLSNTALRLVAFLEERDWEAFFSLPKIFFQVTFWMQFSPAHAVQYRPSMQGSTLSSLSARMRSVSAKFSANFTTLLCVPCTAVWLTNLSHHDPTRLAHGKGESCAFWVAWRKRAPQFLPEVVICEVETFCSRVPLLENNMLIKACSFSYPAQFVMVSAGLCNLILLRIRARCCLIWRRRWGRLRVFPVIVHFTEK